MDLTNILKAPPSTLVPIGWVRDYLLPRPDPEVVPFLFSIEVVGAHWAGVIRGEIPTSLASKAYSDFPPAAWIGPGRSGRDEIGPPDTEAASGTETLGMHGLNSHEASELMRRRWKADLTQDPITQVVAEFQDRMEYHERHGEHSISAALREAVGMLRMALATIAAESLPYDEAALVTSLARGTVRNRESDRDPKDPTVAGRGSVRIQNLPLRPGDPPTETDQHSEKQPRQPTRKDQTPEWDATSIAPGILGQG